MCNGVRPCPLASFTCLQTPRHASPPALAAPVAAALSRARPGTGPRVRRRPPEEGPSDSDAGDSEDGDSDDSSHGALTPRRSAIAGARHSAPRKRSPRRVRAAHLAVERRSACRAGMAGPGSARRRGAAAPSRRRRAWRRSGAAGCPRH